MVVAYMYFIYGILPRSRRDFDRDFNRERELEIERERERMIVREYGIVLKVCRYI